jgi:hypothetical protein
MNWAEFWGFGRREYPVLPTPMYSCTTMAPPAQTYCMLPNVATEDQKALAASLRRLREVSCRDKIRRENNPVGS